MSFEGLILDERYEIISKLGAGGMAEVFLADDLVEKTQVAVKIMPPGSDEKNDYVLRFQREFKVCAALNHPNVVKMFTCGQTPDKSSWYYAMELFNCRDLEQVLRDQRVLSPEDTLRIAVPMAQAFRHYHKNNIVHRDLKPSNIMVEKSGRVVIVDFGLVHDPSRTQLTKTGMMIGTPLYMTPELLTGVKPDRRSDIFQLGSILHECLCGTPAFHGKTLQEVAGKILHGGYLPVRQKNPSVPEDWEIFLRNCVAKIPVNRYQNGDEVLKDLIKLSKGMPLTLFGKRVPESSTLPKPGTSQYPVKEKSIPLTSDLKQQGDTTNCEPITDSTPQSKARTLNQNPESEPPPIHIASRTRKIIGPLLIIAVLGLLIASRFFLSENPESTIVINALTVTKGKNSAAVFWTSPSEVKSPEIVVNMNTGNETFEDVSKRLTFSPVEIKSLSDSRNKLMFHHSVIVKGLQSNSKYSVAMITDKNGNKTLPRSFTTTEKKLEEVFKLSSDGSLIITIDDNIPFTCEVIGNGIQFAGDQAYKESKQYIKGILTVPFDSLKNDYPVSYRLRSIDGDLLQSALTGHEFLGSILDRIYIDFMKSREISERAGTTYVPFFSTWDFKEKQNWLFKKNSASYIKSISKEDKRESLTNFWNEIEEKLSQEFLWYRMLTPLLPGLGKFIREENLSWKFKQKIALALLGIELIQGTSVSYRVPDNSSWNSLISPQSRPFRFSDKSALPPESLTITGIPSLKSLNNDEIPIHLVHDMSYPENYDKLRKSVLLPFLSDHELLFEIPENTDFIKAEIVLDFRTTGNPALIASMNFNNGEFIASVRPTRKHFVDFHESWHPQKNFDVILVRHYAENQLLSIGQVIDGASEDNLEVALPKFKKTIIATDQNLPHITGVSLYHEVPVEILRKGINRVKIEVLAGPSAMPKPLIYKTVRIILSK